MKKKTIVEHFKAAAIFGKVAISEGKHALAIAGDAFKNYPPEKPGRLGCQITLNIRSNDSHIVDGDTGKRYSGRGE